MIQHVALELRREQVADCLAFYRLLGFEDVEPPPTLRDAAAWLQRAGTQIHLMFVDDPVAPPQGHVAVVLDDYDRKLRSLQDSGHEPEPRRRHWGSPRAFVRDPAGHRVEVMAFAPRSADPRD